MKQLPINNYHFNQALNGYAERLSVQGASEEQVEGKPALVRELLHFMEESSITKLSQINQELIDDYFEYLSTRPLKTKDGTASVAYLKKHREAVLRFIEYVQSEEGEEIEIGQSGITIRIEGDEDKDIEILTEEEIEQLYATTDYSLIGIRNRAMLSLLYGCGLRRKELRTLDVEDIDLSRGIVHLPKTKTKYARDVPMSPKVQQDIEDYLGNVRVVISDEKLLADNNTNNQIDAGDHFYPSVKSFSDYYPFGSPLPGRTYNNADYRYGFNGKEQDNDMGNATGAVYDYGFRIYDSRVGKFLSTDPLFRSFAELTPYQFASNSPIWASDLDGLESNRENGYLIVPSAVGYEQFVSGLPSNHYGYTEDNGFDGYPKRGKNHIKEAFTLRDGSTAYRNKVVQVEYMFDPIFKHSNGSRTALKTGIWRWRVLTPIKTVPMKTITEIPKSEEKPVLHKATYSGIPKMDNVHDTKDNLDVDIDVNVDVSGDNEDHIHEDNNEVEEEIPDASEIGDVMCFSCWQGTRTEHWNSSINKIIDWLEDNPKYKLEVNTTSGGVLDDWWTGEIKEFSGRYAELVKAVYKASNKKYGPNSFEFKRAESAKGRIIKFNPKKR